MGRNAKPALLYLCHRIPFPPNKGDKIRSFHLLKFLCEHYRVFLGAFVDDAEDWQYADTLKSMCEDVCLVGLSPFRAKLKSLSGLLLGQALSIPYYRNVQLQRWVNQVVTHTGMDRAVVFSSAMAEYIIDRDIRIDRKVLDMVDMDSDKWRQYAQSKAWPLSWLYQREADCLLAYERHAAATFDFSFFVSEPEANQFLSSWPQGNNRVGYYNNGVNADYFNPQGDYLCPYALEDQVLVFTGAMDYWPNVDAVVWFAKEVFPLLRETNPNLKFYVVGRNPTRQVRELTKQNAVEVTGAVIDIRPYIQYAFAAVAPMRIARGLQNKVLEAMAMEKNVLVSKLGLEGIHANNGVEVLLANTASEYLACLDRLYNEQGNILGRAARTLVKREFSWETTLPRVRDKLECNQDAINEYE